MRLSYRFYGTIPLVFIALTSIEVQAKAPDTQQLKIDIVARIADRCGVTSNSARVNDEVPIDQPQNVSFGFTLDCNTPFRIGVATRNGGLRLLGTSNDGAVTDDHGFSIQKPYTVGLSFMTDQDGFVDAGECDSAHLTASVAKCAYFGSQPGDGFSPGRKTTAVRLDGKLAIRWTGEDGAHPRMAAGKYEDIITVVVGPRT